eukprot:gene7945-8801_t
MSIKSESEVSDLATCEDDSTASRKSSTGRSWSSSLPRSRKNSKNNSRIATVKPVAKCLSSSEEDLSKSLASRASPMRDLGSTSPRLVRLLSKDVACMEKDSIVAELEKCLTELEQEDTSYKPLIDEFNKIEEERDELAIELENAFEDLEVYMQHVKEVEADKTNLQSEKEELSKEVESLKYVLTNRQQIQQDSLTKDKRSLESRLDELMEENQSMKEQINELLEERQSLIESLLNLHSAEVDDVIQTRSRSCSTVSMESVASSTWRTEISELRESAQEAEERAQEAEEAEVTLTNELLSCRDWLKEALEDKVTLEDENETLYNKFATLEKENARLKSELEAVNHKQDKNDSRDEKSQDLVELRLENNKEKQCLQKEITQLEEKLHSFKNNETMFIETRNSLKQAERDLNDLKKEKANLEKKMAEIGEKLLNERAKGKQDRTRLEDEVERVKVVLNAGQEELRRLKSVEIEKRKLEDEFHGLIKDNDKLKSQLAELNDNLERNEDEKDKLEEKITELNIENRTSCNAKDELTKVQTELEKTNKIKEKLVVDKNNIQTELANVKSQFGKERILLTNEKSDLEQFVKHLEDRISSLKNVQQGLKESDATVNSLSKQLSRLKDEKQTMEIKYEEERKQLKEDKAELEDELEASAVELKELDERIVALTRREEKLKENEFQVRKLEQTLTDKLKDDHAKREVEEELKKEVGSFRIEQDRLNDEIKDLKNKLRVKEDRDEVVGNLNSALESERIKLCELESENDVVRAKCKEFESLATSLRKDKSLMQSDLVKVRSERMALKSDLEEKIKQLNSVKSELESTMGSNEKLKEEIRLLKEKVHPQANGSAIAVSEEVQTKDISNVQIKQQSCESCSKLKKDLTHTNKEKSAILKDLNSMKQKVDSSQFTDAKLKVSIDKLNKEISNALKENSSLKSNIESVKKENIELNNKFQTASQNSADVNIKMKRFEEENLTLQKQVVTLQDNLVKASEETRVALEKAKSVDENNANMMRSLKARKNELQTLLTRTQHEKELLGKEASHLKAQVNDLQTANSNVKERSSKEAAQIEEWKQRLDQAEERTRDANLKAAEMELQTRECTRKLHESERLILDLQRAVARANDVAMEKTLESSRNKRLLEKKIERVLKETSNKQHRQFFYDGPPTIAENSKVGRSHSTTEPLTRSPPLMQTNGTTEQRHDITEQRHDAHLVHTHQLQEPKQRNNLQYSASELHVRRKKSFDELQNPIPEPTDAISLSRSGSAPPGKRLSLKNPQVVKTTVTARSVTPPVRYTSDRSDTESVGSKPDSNEGDSAPPQARKQHPPLYHETKRNESERQSLSGQPERVHRPILLKEIPFPNLSPSSQRRTTPTSPNLKLIKSPNITQRMEHWV